MPPPLSLRDENDTLRIREPKEVSRPELRPHSRLMRPKATAFAVGDGHASRYNCDMPKPFPQPPPDATVVGLGATTIEDVIAEVEPGASASVTVRVTVRESMHLLSGKVVIASPGAHAGAGEPDRLSMTAAARPENQIVSSPTLHAADAGIYTLTVRMRATTPGRFPVFLLTDLVWGDNDARTTSIPAGPHHTCQPLGSVIVR
jgi:hypothetical protein